jgi:hypothetical protein
MLYENAPLYLQIPKCTTKNGLVKAAKKMTSELLIDNMNEETVGWFENLDNRSKEMIQKHSEEWFGKEISTEDIDNAFGGTIRLYKSGKFSLVKTNIKLNTATEVPLISVYDEKQIPQPVDSIGVDTNIVSILEITGIRFTSKHFNVEIDLKQIMIVDDSYEEDICFNKCMITPRGKIDSNDEPIMLTPTPTPTLTLTPNADNEVELEPFDEHTILTPTTGLSFSSSHEDSLDNECPLKLKTYVDNEIQSPEPTLETDELSEVDCLQSITLDEMTLNKPEEIYYELYRKTKQKAKEALLEAKRIKEQYQLDVSDWETSDEEYED